MVLLLYAATVALVLPAALQPPPTWRRGRSAAPTMMATAGKRADLKELLGFQWSRARQKAEAAAPAGTAGATDDGACYIVPDGEAPDPSKDWFFCSDPSDDPNMVCELVPEWMGEAPGGDHAVWLCSTAKPKAVEE